MITTIAVLLLAVGAVAGFRLFFADEPDAPAAHVHARPLAPASATVAAPIAVVTASAPAIVPTAKPVPSADAPAPVVTTSAPHAAVAAGVPRLAIIIDDCGQWPVTERAFIALPFALTLSVLPHVRYGTDIAGAAASAGKGVMMHLPMETVSGRDPGPGTITTAMDDGAIRSLVAADLADVPLARGVNNHEGSRATADTRVMNDVADVIAGDGRFFIDSRTSAKTVAESVAHERGIPVARRNVFLDDVDDVAAIEAQLRHAADIAHANGSAIAIGHPRQATLDAVRALAPELQAGGLAFVLASELVR